MTNIDFSDIMKTLIFSISKKEGSIKISMEVNAGNNNKDIILLHCKSNCTCITNGNMDELKVDLLEAANYLILLFYRTDQEYSCTRTKVGKLLSIVAFSYARNNKKIFEESIYKYDDCGCAIKKIMNTFDRDIYARCQYNDNQKYISDVFRELSSLDPEIQEKYKDIVNVDPTVRQKIEEVFRTFGAYSPTKLGECINPIVKQTGVINANGEVDLSKIYTLKRSEIQIDNSTPKALIDYLF